jgi:RHS repeat-associated protein
LDKVGNRTAIAETVNGVNRTASYSYDELARLTQEIQTDNGTSATSNYTYDKVGNRQVKLAVEAGKTTNYTYDDADRLLSDVTTGGGNTRTNNYQYDVNGSLVTETNSISGFPHTGYRYYQYDTRNRLVGWQGAPAAYYPYADLATFTYDGANTRTKMSYRKGGGANPLPQETTTYLQDIFGGYPVVLQENNTTTGQTSYYQYALGSTSPLFQTNTGANNNLLWYHSDGLGSVRALTNSSGAVVNSQNYGAFGELRDQTGGSAVTNNHLFTGEQQDPTGLYYLRARYYHTTIGRFISRDDYAGENSWPSTLNRYSYVVNNPLKWVDPSGYKPQECAGSCRIELRIKAMHVLIVFTDAVGKRTIFEGNFDEKGRQWLFALGPWQRRIPPFRAERLIGVNRPYEPRTDDMQDRKGESYDNIVLMDGEAACEKEKCLIAKEKEMTSWQLIYRNDILFEGFQNSNSFAFSLLEYCGIKHGRQFWWPAPGYGVPLKPRSLNDLVIDWLLNGRR